MSEGRAIRRQERRVPYYDSGPLPRAIRAQAVRFGDGIGVHLICPRGACRRGGGCADRDARQLPFCWRHCRGLLRFFTCVAKRRLGGPGPNDDEMLIPGPFKGRSLLARLAAIGVPIDDLARPAADGPDDFEWETIPEYQQLFRKLTEGYGNGGPGTGG